MSEIAFTPVTWSGAKKMNDRLVTNDELDRALSFLRDSAISMGQAKARLVMAGHMVSHIEALMIVGSEESSADKRKADARASDRYKAAIEEEADAAGDFEKLKSLREAAAMKIEAWRSEQANYRAMKV